MINFAMVQPVNVITGNPIRRLSSLAANLFQKAITLDTLIVSQVSEKMDWHVNAKSAEFAFYFNLPA